jgi:hypothetical protein
LLPARQHFAFLMITDATHAHEQISVTKFAYGRKLV